MRKRAMALTASLLMAWLGGGPASGQTVATPPKQAVATPATEGRPDTGEAAKEVAAKIDNFSFSPQVLTVTAGTTVRWTNRDDIPHTVVANDKSFKSKVLDTDETFAYTFTQPGTYFYFCSVHPKMTGKVVVQ